MDDPSGPEAVTRGAALTGQQAAAVARREASVVLSSGAGCGKTHVLTERYLSHLRDDGADVGQLVAITFTDRAARQMRDRIRRAVAGLLRRAPTPDEAAAWEKHLRGLETAPISTIHAFCGTLLRQHALEVGLDPGFDVLEDVLSVNLEAEALTASLQQLLTAATEAGEELRELVVLYGWRPVVEGVRHLLRQGGGDWSKWAARPAADVAAAWAEYARWQLLPQQIQFLGNANPKVARCLRLLRDFPPKSGSKVAAGAALVTEGFARLAQAEDLAGAVEELCEAAKVGREGAKVWPSEEAYQAIKDAFDDFRKTLREQQLEAFAAAPENVAAAVTVGQRFVRVAAEAVRAYRELKRQKGVLDFQDLLVLARDLLRDNPEVRERLQRRYRFLLIDELQDTDPVQMELVESLCGEGLMLGKLFAVGDPSQSIYRFRGAKVGLFRDLRHQVPHEGRLGLTLNFRSQPAILDFTNALLGHRLEAYEPLVAHRAQVNPGPCVEFLWSPRGEREGVAEARMREAEWIARRVAAMIGREALVVDAATGAPRPARRGDVVLLFRAMSNVAYYESALRAQGLPYYLVGGRAFFAQQEIYDILNLLRALENPQDAVSLAGALRSPFCCLSDEALFLLSRARGGVWAGLHDEAAARLPQDQRDRAARACRFLDRWREGKDRWPIARLLGEVFADSGYDAATQYEYLGDRKLANLWKITELARTFDRSGLFGLAEFIARLGDLVRAQPREEQAATQPENADVIRLMTIHQAKGLEFPVVVVPDLGAVTGAPFTPVVHWDNELGCVARPPADDNEPPFPDFGWRLWKAREAMEDWHEDLRTLYVACTRAEDYLILSGSVKHPFTPTNAWTLALAERFDPHTGASRVPTQDPRSVPQVRVIDDVSDFPAPEATGPQPGEGAALPEQPATGVEGIPVRLRSKRIYTVAELDYYRRVRAGGPGLFAEPLRPEDFAPQYDAEDGSDRNAWPGPAPGLDRLLGAAVACHRNLDYLVEWPETEGRYALAGVVDALWQDAEGNWHLLDAAPAGTGVKDRKWTLTLAAWAVQRRLGSPPRTVTVWSSEADTAQTWQGQHLPYRKVLDEAAALLQELAQL